VWSSRNIYTALVIVKSWDHIIQRQRVYGELISLASTKIYNVCNHVKCSKLLHKFNQIWTFSTDFHKHSMWNFTKIHPMAAPMVHADRKKNWRIDVTEVIWTFRDCAFEPKTISSQRIDAIFAIVTITWLLLKCQQPTRFHFKVITQVKATDVQTNTSFWTKLLITFSINIYYEIYLSLQTSLTLFYIYST